MRDWSAACAAHRESVERFVSAAGRLAAPRWTAEPAPGKWSPAQIAEHLSLTYERLLAELRGGAPMRRRGRWYTRLLARYWFLPAVLRTGRIPSGVPSPREVRPQPTEATRSDALLRFRSLASEFEREITARRSAGGVTLTHPYFGALTAEQSIRFVEVHIRHHSRQLPEA